MADGGAAGLSHGRKLLVADLFCGAGGSSTGARRALAALGCGMTLVAVNHWDTAIETHSRNHPEARHYLRDLMSADPIELVPEGKLDLLMASPTCTHHSRARGGRPSSDQQRMDPWAIVRWCSELRVKRLLIENVPEFVEWGPINLVTGRPIRRRKGEYFRAWAAALKGLGFRVEWRVLNAADYGDATTRVRFFLMARSDGKRVLWPAPTHRRQGGDQCGDLFGSQKWRAAREIIDWSLAGQSIYDRKRPLAPATLARIHAGAVKFAWPEPYLVVLRRHMAAQSLDAPLPSLTAGGNHVGLAEPCLVNMKGRSTASSIEEPAPTITAHSRHLAIAEPFLLPQRSDKPARRIEDPTPTITTVSRIGLVEPFVCGNRTNNTAKSLDEPIGGITTTTGGGQFLVEPFLATVAHGTAEGDTHDRRCRSLEEPLQTIHAGGGKFALVEPFVLSQASGGAPRGVSAPVPAIPTGGAHALICPYYGSGSGETCGSCDAQHGERDGQAPRVHSIDDPVPTICATGRVQLAQPDERTWDIRFRMLQPHELAAAMGFTGDDAAYEFAGNKTEITRQIGNAVPVNTACALVKALCDG